MVTPAATAATTSVTTTPPPAAFPSFTAPSPVPPQQHYEGIFYGGVDVIQVPAAAAAALPQLVKKAFARENASHVSAAVRLQAAARGLIARRRLQEMRRQIHEAALMVVDLGKGVHVLASSNGHQQPRRSAAVFMREHGGGRGGVFLFVTGGNALPPAAAFCHRPPRGRLRWLLSRLIPGGYTRAPLSFRWAPWDPGGYTRAGPSRGGCPPYLQESKIKSHNLFQVNKISRDVKGLFLSDRFASSRVRLQLEDELHVQVGCSVRRVKGLLGLSPLGLISRLLRDQVRPLYIMRGDVSI
jgi:hypothetical protein